MGGCMIHEDVDIGVTHSTLWCGSGGGRQHVVEFWVAEMLS
jgi:hypothetical protein